jgi:hypothetical protein
MCIYKNTLFGNKFDIFLLSIFLNANLELTLNLMIKLKNILIAWLISKLQHVLNEFQFSYI